MLLQVIKLIHLYLLLVSPHPDPFQVSQAESSKSQGYLFGRIGEFLLVWKILMRLALSYLHNPFHYEMEKKKRNGKESPKLREAACTGGQSRKSCSSISGMVWQFCNAAQASSREQNDSVQRRQS